jgi:hydroxypyruvate isomerase
VTTVGRGSLAGPGTGLVSRREVIAAGAAAIVPGLALSAAAPGGAAAPPAGPGRLRQSVCRWPFASIPLPEFCRSSRAMAIEAIDLLNPDEWSVARDHGLACSMGNSSRRRDFLTAGIADPSMHDTIVRELEETIPLARAAGVPNVIVLSGNRRGRTDAEGVDACVRLLGRVVRGAEAAGVTICLEMLNSRVDHRDHFADTTGFGVAVARGVNSPSFKLLYDVYHMQVMEGDVIATIRRHAQHIAHFHTAGVPGRHELDESQELNYAAIARAIADLGFEGYLAHEFIPTRDPMTSLREAVAVCTV